MYKIYKFKNGRRKFKNQSIGGNENKKNQEHYLEYILIKNKKKCCYEYNFAVQLYYLT